MEKGKPNEKKDSNPSRDDDHMDVDSIFSIPTPRAASESTAIANQPTETARLAVTEPTMARFITTRKRQYSRSMEESKLDSSVVVVPTVSPLHRLRWYQAIDTWISTISWKRVLILKGPSGSGKTFCIDHYLMERLKVRVHRLRAQAFGLGQTMEQQIKTLLSSSPQSETVGQCRWLLHIHDAHPLEMMKMSDWKYLESLYLSSHSSLRAMLPCLVIEVRPTEFQRWKYSPLLHQWKQSAGTSLETVHTDPWSYPDLRQLGTLLSYDEKRVLQALDSAHSDARQFLIRYHFHSFQHQQHQQSMLLNGTMTKRARYEKTIVSPLRVQKGLTSILAELFTTTSLGMQDFADLLRHFALTDHLDYRLLDLCIIQNVSIKGASTTTIGSIKATVTIKVSTTIGPTTKVSTTSGGLDDKKEMEKPGIVWLSMKQWEEIAQTGRADAFPIVKTTAPPSRYTRIVPVRSTPKPTLDFFLQESPSTLEQIQRDFQKRWLDTLHRFYRRTRGFHFRRINERWTYESALWHLQVASLAFAHHVKWEWKEDKYTFTAAKERGLWSEIARRLGIVRVFLFGTTDTC